MSTEATNGHGDRDEAGTGSPAPETAKAELARVYVLLLARAGENQVELRLDATRRACEVLGDIHTAAPTITVTGTNGKTSTARMLDSLVTAHDLQPGPAFGGRTYLGRRGPGRHRDLRAQR